MENSNNTGIILAVFTAVVFMFFIFEVMTNTNKISQLNVPNININEEQTFNPKISISDNSITQQDNIVRNRRNNINRRNANNGCRNYVPYQHELVSRNDDLDFRNKLTNIHRTVSEFRNYTRQRYINYIQNNDDENNDLRLKFLNKSIQEKHYKSQIHKRDKERQFKKNICQLFLIMFETVELYLWEITTEENISIKRNIFQNMLDLKDSTNNKIQELIPLFGYHRHLQINNNFRGYPYL